jgi:hypothetical protein
MDHGNVRVETSEQVGTVAFGQVRHAIMDRDGCSGDGESRTDLGVV